MPNLKLDKLKAGRRPPKVDRAVKTNDLASLRYFGSKGAEVTNRIKAEKAANKSAEAAHYEEKAAAEEAARRQQANEHITPIDSEDGKEVA